MLKILYVVHECGKWQDSAIPRYLAHHPGVDLVFCGTAIDPQPLGEPKSAYLHTHWEDFPAWVKGELKTSNGYVDTAIEWRHIEDRWIAHYAEAPDLIVVAETEFVPCGRKHIFDGVPCAFLAVDCHRGVDQELRRAKSCGATDIFHPAKWFGELFSLQPPAFPDLAPAGQVTRSPNSGHCHASERVHYLPVCADPFYYFEPDHDTPPVLDVMFSGNAGWADKDGRTPQHEWKADPLSGADMMMMRECPVRFGNEYGEYAQRARLLWLMLQDQDVPLQVIRGSIGHEYANVMRGSKIVWSCEPGPFASNNHDTYRLWRAAACGCCVLKNEAYDTHNLFAPDWEVLTYRLFYDHRHHLFEWFDYQAMRNKLLYWLSDDRDRRAIGHAAAVRTRKEHLPEHRFQSMLDAMGMTL